MYEYKYEEFLDDLDLFCKSLGRYKPDVILAIARGGVTFGHFLSEKLNLRELYTLNSVHYNDTIKLETIELFNIPKIDDNLRVLVVDDIVDSGDTMTEVMRTLRDLYPKSEFKSGVLFYKEDASYKPDFKVKIAKEWIRFFWNI